MNKKLQMVGVLDNPRIRHSKSSSHPILQLSVLASLLTLPFYVYGVGCDVNDDTRTNVSDVQIVVNAALGGACMTGTTPPPPPPPPPTSGFILRDGTNTGLAGAGIAEGSLTSQGGITYGTSFNGQTISGRRFTGTVTLSGSNITIDGSLFQASPGANTIVLINTGTGNVVRNSTFRTTANRSVYIMVHQRSGSLRVERCDISQGENNITVDGGSLHLVESYIHEPSGADNPDAHIDGIEIYGGSNHILERSTISNRFNGVVAPINIAPWYGSTVVSNTTIQDNYLDGGNLHILIDQQSTGGIRYTRVLRNRFGGHTFNFGSYGALANYESRPILQTEAQLQSNPDAILWPTGSTDPNRNLWYYCTNNPFGFPNLSPDRTGQVVTP